MKKIILILLLSFSSFLGYSQLNEGFEGAPGNPDLATGVWALPSSASIGTWLVTDNQADTNQNLNWRLQNSTPATPYLANTGSNAAYIDRQNTGAGVLSEEWLITPRLTIAANSQFRFFTRQTQTGNRQTKYQIRVSSGVDQADLSSYQVLIEYDEDALSTITPDQLDYEEKVLNLAFSGQRYFAFVKVFTQPGLSTDGDRWLVDDVRVVERCQDPREPNIDNLTSTSVTFTWRAPLNTPSQQQYEIEYGNSGFTVGTGVGTPTGIISPAVTDPRRYPLPGNPLTPGTNYQFYVRSVCADSNSNWIGPFNFSTPPRGSLCSDPKVVPVLPYQDNSNTTIYGNNITATSPGSTGCGTTGTFLAGNDVVYAYTPLVTGFLNIKLNPLGATNTGLFVYSSCANVGNTCIGGVGNANANIREITSLPVTAGNTIYILLSSTAATPTYPYTLIIQEANCTPPLLSSLHADTFGTTSGTLDWSNGTGSTATSWQVAVQPFGALIPSGAGVTAGVNVDFPVSATVDGAALTPGTAYQFWVRADCGNGLFSPWTGPVAFNTSVCEAVDKCNYTFTLTDTGNNGWQNGTMQVKQNGIVVQTIGAEITNGGPTNVTVALCHNLPFELYWNAGGANASQIRVAVKNSFGQTLYSMTTASAALVGTTLFGDLVDCINPKCQVPTGVLVPTATVFTTTATVNWTSSGVPTTAWEIYIREVGQPAPGAGSIPNYTIPGTDPTSFVLPNLDPDTQYNVYIRSVCSVNGPSPWTPAVTFTTIPTCYKPTPLTVATATIGTNQAILNWTNGLGSNTVWEILLIPAIQGATGPEAPPAPADVPVITPGTKQFFHTGTGGPFTATGLDAATIYYYYIRTVCSPTDSSNWGGPIIFNTVTCDAAAKCNYKFLLTATPGNTWNGGRIQVRQNGIVVQTLGASAINAAAGVTVGICPGVPFDLYWSVAGTSPEVMGITVVNPFLDVLYTKAPGTGTPQTILFQSTGNCTAAPCSKPTGMAATTTATEATLSWTDNSSPVSSNFALYVVPTGDPAPTNIPPSTPTISPVLNGVTISTLNGTIPLQPSTSYTYYVKALCADASTSSWTVLTPTTFITKPLNDECLSATPVPVNSGQQCVSTASGSTLGATASTLPTIPAPTTNCGLTSNDVWFSFVATSPNHTINLTDLVGTPAAATLSHSLFSGACDNLTKMYCTNTLSSAATNLTVGNTYYIRVYNSAATAGQFVTFKVCITSPPVNDVCEGAVNVQVNPNQVCSVKTAGNTLGALPSLPTITGTGCGTTDDDVWFKFTATNNIHIINISDLVPSPSTATTLTLNHSFWSGDCTALVNSYCSTAAESVATGLVVGQTYYIRVYTAGSVAGQSATFNICIKTPPPPATNNECATAIALTVNPSSVCATTTPGNIIGATASTGVPGTCVGNANDDVWFSFTATSTRHFISLLNVEGTTTDLNHAVYSGACGTLALKYCSAANSLTSNNATFVVGQTYYIRVWSNSAASQVVTFNMCVKSVSTCQNATPFCGSSPANPFIFENTTGIPSTGPIACLGSNPNPTFYTLHVGQTGPLSFNILQNSAFDSSGNPTGNNLDVDFVAWGPFTSTQACAQISFADCPSCPNNTSDPNFYPFGNIVDCSYDGSFTETLSIPNAIQDEYYVVLITNFIGGAGYIRLVQTNFGSSGAGETICCSVGLGPDKSVCDTSAVLNALEDVEDINNVPLSFEWFYNGSTTPIPGETGPTITVTQSGTYKVTGSCGVNPVQDTIQVSFNVTPTPVTTITQATCLVPTGTVEVTAPVATVGVLPTNLYISEITDEGTGSLSYVEIYNGTGAPVDLSNYKLKNYNNGATTTTCELLLTGIMANNTTYIVRLSSDPNVGGIIPNQTLACGGVNTNDNIQLTTIGDVVVDNWGRTDGVNFTPNNQTGYNYIRNASATAPSTGWDPADWTITDWTATVLPVYTTLGSHTPAFVSNYQYNIDGGTWQTSTTFSGVAIGIHTINVKDIVTGCTSSAQIEITASNLITPVTTIGYVSPICKNDTNPHFPDTTALGFVSGGRYESDQPTLLVVDIATGEINLALSTPGSYTVTYTVDADLPNCIAGGNSSAPVVIDPVIIPDFPTIPPVCTGTVAPILGTTSPNGITGTWSPPTIDNLNDGTYVFTPDAGQCADQQTLNVTITVAGIAPDFAAIAPFCSGTTAPILAGTSPNGITGIWSPTTIDNLNDGTYVFTPDAGQCATQQTLNVTITAPNIVPDFAAITPFCSGNVAPILGSTSPNGITGIWSPSVIDNTADGTYVFTPDAGQCAVQQTLNVTITPPNVTPTFGPLVTLPFCSGSTASPLPLTSQNGITGTWNPPAINNTQDGNYTFTPDGGQCALPVTIGVTVTPTITPDFAPIAAICNGAAVPTLATTSPNGITGSWNPATIDAVNSATYVFTPDAGQCATNQSLDVTIGANPNFVVVGACKNNKYTLSVSSTTDFESATYIWRDQLGNIIGTNDPELTVTQAGNYTLEIIFEGCTATKPFNAVTISCIIQKGISPKGTGIGDGKNDNFDLSGQGVSKLQIFNRYGAVVYSKKRYTDQWYGQSDKGEELPDGTYFYVIDYDSQETQTGWIYINHEE